MTLLLDTNYLPPTAAELVDVIGLAATLRLVECAGGIRVWVPQHLDREHSLVRWLGLEAAESLASHVGGGELSIPRCAAALRAARNQAIVQAKNEGVTVPKLARDFGLTDRQVFNILARVREDDHGQRDMFAAG